MGNTPRLRLFAGPNGSGKSSLKSYLRPSLLGVYLNPDEMETSVKSDGFLNLNALGVETDATEILGYFRGSTLLQKKSLLDEVEKLSFSDGKLDFSRSEMNSYFASVAADFIRRKLMDKVTSLTFESVMSHPGKVALLAEAQARGYRTYLYYIATNDPEINLSRVRSRVARGGHSVPPDKIVSRYHRSLDLLVDAIKVTNRAYIFDNSTTDSERTWLAEVTDGRDLELKSDKIPVWFQRAVIDKISGTS